MKRLILIILFHLSVIKVFACFAEDNTTITERLYLNKAGTIFTCRIIYMEDNAIWEESQMTAIVTEIFFGTVDRDTVILSVYKGNNIYQDGSSDGIAYPTVKKDTIIRTDIKENMQVLIYSDKSGHKFFYGGMNFNKWSKGVNNSPEVQNELNLLRQFSSIFKEKKSGIFTFYNSKNIIIATGEYKKGVAKGHWKHFTDNGIIKTEIDFKEGIMNSYTKNGNLNYGTKSYKDSSISYMYTEGVLYAKVVAIDKDTITISTGYSYYPNGKIKDISSVIHNKKSLISYTLVRTGKYFEYYENGNLKVSGRLDKDKRVGLWKWYKENGDFNSEFDYKDGKGNQ
jgi:antitoxin component YwqK of YwqJK toxin-antitoxin module